MSTLKKESEKEFKLGMEKHLEEQAGHSYGYTAMAMLAVAGFALKMGTQAYNMEFNYVQSTLIGVAVFWFHPSIINFYTYMLPFVLAGHCLSLGPEFYPSLLEFALIVPLTLVLIGIPMSMCLHRYFAHGAFQTSRPMQLVIGLLACLANQGGPIWWAAKHRRHHRHCDLANDPHSPTVSGYWMAWLGWTMLDRSFSTADRKYIPESMLVPELLALDVLFPVPIMAVVYAVHHYLGYSTMVWTTLFPMLLSRVITLLFNVEYHPETETGKLCKGVDVYRYMGTIVGESLHAEHHKWPRQSHRNDLDLPYWLCIKWLSHSGLIWDLH